MMNRTRKRVAVGSRNPVKLQAVEAAFRRVFPEDEFVTIAVDVTSGVADQPRGDAEALSGALNRAQAVSAAEPTADFCVGIEGAIEDTEAGMEVFSWIVVTSQRRVGRGRTATFFLPEQVAGRVRRGAELGEAIDAVFGTVDARSREGAVGLLTGNVLGRVELYEQGVIAALIPLRNLDLYPDSPAS
jgi:inosine/xanthosine triphosphatase